MIQIVKYRMKGIVLGSGEVLNIYKLGYFEPIVEIIRRKDDHT